MPVYGQNASGSSQKSVDVSDSSDTSEPLTRAGLGDLLGGLDLGSLLEAVGSDSSTSSSSAGGTTGTGTDSSGSTGSSLGSGAASAAMDILMGLLGVSGRKISDCKISAIADQKYTGKPITPLPVITCNGTRLKKNTDYTVRYSDNTKIGTAKCIITGKGNYEGQKTVSFKIVSKSSKAGKSGGSSSKTGKSGDSSSKTGKSGSSSSQADNSGTRSAKFTVKLSATTYTYNGTAKKPTVKVTAGKKTVPKTQYTVTYKNNKNVGKATVTVKGKGDYKGYQGEATFKIELKKTALKSASSPAAGEIKAGWTADTQADSYQLQACTNKSFSSGVKKLTVKPGNKTTGSFTGLTTGKKYYVRIRSCKKVGSTNWYSTWSAARQVTVK